MIISGQSIRCNLIDNPLAARTFARERPLYGKLDLWRAGEHVEVITLCRTADYRFTKHGGTSDAALARPQVEANRVAVFDGPLWMSTRAP